ncbi:hypothetical protein [Iocasia frigidifontis]|nr:hypothetical protein [Iocasia fonsfrigidae]
MIGLFLPGYACTSYIWEPLEREIYNDFSGKIIDWPTETKRYDKIEDFTEWIIKRISIKRRY